MDNVSLMASFSLLFPGPTAGDTISPQQAEVTETEGQTVTLTCSYQTSAYDDYFFWYRQYPGTRPTLVISHSGTGEKILQPVSGFTVQAVDNNRQIDLQISSAAVTDSAVYYCAVRPTVTGNSKTLYKNLWSKDNRILHNIH
uniref:Ig-like domain-containing protein n=1 Tax=Amphilophus citrinellus TaxID=61819 RepID=A0A3Q0S792_AMPCI